MKKIFLAALTALMAIAAPSAAIAEQTAPPTTAAAVTQEAPAVPPVSKTDKFVGNLGMTEVLPNFYLSQMQMDELKNSQCTAGPTGLFKALREDMARYGDWCSPKVNAKLADFFKSGAVGYTLTALPTSVRLTVYDQAVNLNRNVRCHADIPYSGMFNLNFTCFDSKSGKQVMSEVIGSIIGNTIPMVSTALVSNLTAPRAGDINVGSQSTSDAKASGGGGGGPTYIDISAIGNNAPITSQSGAAANVNQSGCGANPC